jgi:hypothetical protein
MSILNTDLTDSKHSWFTVALVVVLGNMAPMYTWLNLPAQRISAFGYRHSIPSSQTK